MRGESNSAFCDTCGEVFENGEDPLDHECEMARRRVGTIAENQGVGAAQSNATAISEMSIERASKQNEKFALARRDAANDDLPTR